MLQWQKTLVSAVFLLVMLVFAYRQVLAPEPRADTGLDFEALTRHVTVITQKPHPIGSAANRETRDYIVSYFESLGLQTEVQKTTVVYRHPTRKRNSPVIGFVENIIARLPGRFQGEGPGAGDLVVMSHYDSRPLTPGAGDAASGTASIMEAARIMSAAPAPAHDVVFLITDGEEMGLLGAQGFFRQHPSAKDVGLVLNFEARGSYGASFMFETSNNNAWLIDELIASTPDLAASSLSYEIYRQMPNDTDMTISKGEGIPGLNFAFTAGLFDYHAMTDNIQNLDSNTLAHHANNVLATAQHFANLENWQPADGDLTYFNLWGDKMLSYGQGQAVVLGIAVLLLGLWLFVTAKRSGAISWEAVGTGLLGVLILFLVVYSLFENLITYMRSADTGMVRLTSLGDWPLLAFFVLTLGLTLWFGHRLRHGLSRTDILVAVLTLLILIVLAGNASFATILPLVVLSIIMVLVRSRTARPDLWTATLCCWWLLTTLLVYLSPNASYLFVWPLASVLVGIMVQRRLPVAANGYVRFGIVPVMSFIPLLLLPPVYISAYIALGLALPQVLMILCAFSLLLIWPLVRPVGSVADGKVALLLLGAGLVMTAAVMFGRDFDGRHPRPEELFYAIDVDQQQGFWVSSDSRPGSWLDDFMGEQSTVANMTRILPGYEQETMIKETALPDYQVASLKVAGDRLVDGMRELRLNLQPGNAAEYVNLLFAGDAGVAAASVNGFPVELRDVSKTATTGSGAASWWRWRLYGLPQQGAEIMVTMEPAKALQVRIVEVNYGLPPDAPSRPADSMPRPYTWSDSVVTFQTVTLE
mgnify:FL=1